MLAPFFVSLSFSGTFPHLLQKISLGIKYLSLFSLSLFSLSEKVIEIASYDQGPQYTRWDKIYETTMI
jgi:hypothetical protein